MGLVNVPHQNAATILPEIEESGCNFVSIIYLASRHDWKDYNVRDVNQIYWQAVNGGMMRKNCFVTDAGKLFTHLTDEPCTMRFETQDYRCVETPDWVEYEILHYTSRQYGGHFVVGDGHGNIEFDPWEGGSMVIKDRQKKLVKKNIFRVTK